MIKKQIEILSAQLDVLKKLVDCTGISIHVKMTPNEVLAIFPNAQRCRQPSRETGKTKRFVVATIGAIDVWSDPEVVTATPEDLVGPTHVWGW